MDTEYTDDVGPQGSQNRIRRHYKGFRIIFKEYVCAYVCVCDLVPIVLYGSKFTDIILY